MAELPEVLPRVRMSAADAHDGGGLMARAKVIKLFGDVAPEFVGDFLEVTGGIVEMGRTSRRCELQGRKLAVLRPEVSDSAADLLDEPVVATSVMKSDRQRRP